MEEMKIKQPIKPLEKLAEKWIDKVNKLWYCDERRPYILEFISDLEKLRDEINKDQAKVTP